MVDLGVDIYVQQIPSDAKESYKKIKGKEKVWHYCKLYFAA